ncbi:MAG: sulfatase [Casimicrobiaceae bacterium]
MRGPRAHPARALATGVPGRRASDAPWRIYILLGLVLGLTYGFLEAIEFCILSLVPGALAWRSGNTVRILWVAPLVYGTAGAALGVLFLTLSRTVGRVDWLRALVFSAVAGGVYLGAMLQGQLFAAWAAALLGLGVATQSARLFTAHRGPALRIARRGLPVLLGLVGLAAVLELGIPPILERRATARLPVAGARPNVLVLVADTLRADHVGSYGYVRPTTPRLDGLAAEGRLYLHAYSASSWTLPAHASLMTGRALNEHHAGEHRRPYLDGKYPTLAEVLGQGGYATGGFVANVFWCGRQTGLARGFVHYDDLYANGGDALARTVLGRLLAYHVLPKFGWIDIPGRRSAADVNGRLLDWIDTVGDRPFFAFVNYMDVHGPYLPPEGFQGRFSGRTGGPRPTRIELGDIDASTTVRDPAILKAWIDRYDEALLYLDTEIGATLDALGRRGLLDNTIVVFTSDHGESWGEHGLMFHGHSLYQEQVRIPLIVRYPSRVARDRSVDPTSLQDVPALIADLAGLVSAPFPKPAELVGRNVTDDVVAEVGRRTGMPASWPTARGSLRAIQDARWQLIVSDGAGEELYDLTVDPAEMNNLADDPRYVDVLETLRTRLAKAPAPPRRAITPPTR